MATSTSTSSRRARASALFVLTTAACLSARAAIAQDEKPSFERFADSVMSAQLAEHNIPGAVLVVVRDGRVAFARGYGYADLERRIPVDLERTIFSVASVSKLFTATAVIQLVEQGRLDLHADVNEYLRVFKVPSTFAQPVTLFHLLTHTAGFDDSNIARKATDPSDLEPLGEYLAHRLPARVRPPGEFIAYSNHGMALAGHLVEVASGMPFEQCMRERLFAPLEMTHSSFAPVPASADLAKGYEGNPPVPQARDFTKTIPASMLTTSGSDVARFMVAHLDGVLPDGRPLLTASSLAAMHRRQFAQYPLLAGAGLGFWERFQNGERAIWHDGDAAGFASLLYLLPGRRTGYFMAFNSRGGNRARSRILAALLDRELPRTQASAPPKPDGRAAGTASQFAGTYVDLRSGHQTIEKIASLTRHASVVASADGTLLLAGTRYVPLGSGLFQSEDGEGYIVFRMDAGGHVTHLFEGRSIARVSERVPWYGTVNVQAAWLLFCVMGFLWQTASPRGVPRAMWIAAAANLVFIVGFAFTIAGAFGSLEYGVPRILIVLLTVPLATTVLTIMSMVGFAKAWSQSATALSKMRLTVGLMAAIAFVPWLAYWNLVGYRY